MIMTSFLDCPFDLQNDLSSMRIGQVTMNLPTELTWLKDMQRAGDIDPRFRGNVEGGFTLRTEAGITASAVS